MMALATGMNEQRAYFPTLINWIKRSRSLGLMAYIDFLGNKQMTAKPLIPSLPKPPTESSPSQKPTGASQISPEGWAQIANLLDRAKELGIYPPKPDKPQS
jgi:hypothetical protein